MALLLIVSDVELAGGERKGIINVFVNEPTLTDRFVDVTLTDVRLLVVVLPVNATVALNVVLVLTLPKRLATVIFLVVAAPLGSVTATIRELPLRVFAAGNSVIFLVAIF